MSMNLRVAALLLGVIGWTVIGAAQSQAPPAPAPAPEKKAPVKTAKPKKVWTEDDLGSLRTPADSYADIQAAAQAAEQAKQGESREAGTQSSANPEAPAGSQNDSKTGKPNLDPNSPAGIEAQIRNWEDSLSRNDKALEDARRELDQVTDDIRVSVARKKIQLYEQNHEDIKQKLASLHTQLEQARKQSQPGGQPPPPQP